VTKIRPAAGTPAPGDTAADLIAALRAAGELTRAIVSGAELADVSALGGRFSDSDPGLGPRRRGSWSTSCRNTPNMPDTWTSRGN
jgi:hypothetical protein